MATKTPAAKAAKPVLSEHKKKGLQAAADWPVTPKERASAAKPASKKAARKPVKAPKTLAAAADLYYTTREERLGVERSIKDQVEGLKADEGVLREHLIEQLPASDATGVAGKLVRVTVKKGVAPQADDWSKIYAHVVEQYLAIKKKKGNPDEAFAILGRALNSEHIKALWDDGKVVPGVGKFNTKSLSVNKL